MIEAAEQAYVAAFADSLWMQASRRVVAALTVKETERVYGALSRCEEIAVRREPGERLTWRREHLDSEALARVGQPWVDRLLKERAHAAGTETPETRWPEGHPFAVCLSHDMDHVSAHLLVAPWRRAARMAALDGRTAAGRAHMYGQAARASSGAWLRRNLLRSHDRFANTADWMQLEADHGFRSTLYFLPSRIVPWHPYDPDFTFSDRVTFDGRVMPLGAMIRAIHSRGWEIGLHGTFHSATEPGVLAMQKDELEAELGQPIRTVRQHYLQYDPTVTPGIHAAAGLIADGTHGFNDLLGFRAGTAFPYRCWDWATRAPAPLWEVPLHIQDGALLRDNPTVDVAVARCLPLLDAVQSVGGCLSILFHPARLATDSGFAVYRALLGEAKRRGAWGCGTAQLVDWWQARTSAGAAAVSTG